MPILLTASALFAAGALILISYATWLLAADRPATSRSDARPRVLIVVPVYNEAELIDGKLANLAALTYPSDRRRIVIVDGGSTDGTLDRMARSNFEILRTHVRNKTAQINIALRTYPDEQWILVTDGDAILAPDAVERLLDAAASDVGVVGARVLPRSAHTLESVYWRAADWLHALECNRGSAAIVAAPCYLARRHLIAELPDDTLADDVHVACRAMAAGYRVGRADSIVFELRSPRTLRMLLRHKHRKADAYLREIFRFLPVASRMRAPMRTIFLFRAALLTIVPVLWTSAGFLSAMAVVETDALATGTVVAIGFFVAATARGTARFVALAAVLAAVASTALLRYPLSRQTASFPKVR